MRLIPQEKLNRSLNKALLKYRPFVSEINLFKSELIKLLDHIDNSESEEFNKNLVSSFLTNAFYASTHFINTKDRQDLVIHNGKTNKTSVGVIIEAKRPTNKADWLTPAQPNSKALQELVLYYLRERIEAKNIDIKYLIATNINEWYIIEASYFDKLFYHNKQLVKNYEEWRDGKKVTKDTGLFYNDIAKPFIDSLTDEVPCIHFNIRDHEKALRSKQADSNKDINALFKILSPYHLLKVPFANDSNELDDKFYKELLHIIGLEEVKEGTKNIIRRKIENRYSASFLEKAIEELKTEGLHKVTDLKSFGDNSEEQYFNIALELCITWINRILFLKLLEGQLIKYHKGDQQYRFLNNDTVPNFGELFTLFHKVLAVDIPARSPAIKQKYLLVPYLNSSLFEISDLEDVTIKINAIDSSEALPFISSTILKEQKKKNEQLKTIDYLFQFLDAYDFASEDTGDTREDNKALINASVLGKVFEKINGYKDGSIYTPGFITMYMSRQSIRLAVLQKFNEAYNWNCKDFDGLTELIEYQEPETRKRANEIINSLKICDPAVGSGHFLVSALNEIIAIKSDLKILQDINGKRLKEYSIEVVNDELIVTDEDNDIFTYNPQNTQSQLVQQTLFGEKQTLIENCLFGVDINPNSVKICRLRLWIELLKNAFYKQDGNLETLPNIDINIKCGNSLLSRFPLDANLSKALKSIKYDINAYRGFVNDYKNCKDREIKRELQSIIDKIKTDFRTNLDDPFKSKISKARGDLTNLLSELNRKQQWAEKISKEFKTKVEKAKKKLSILEAEKESIIHNVVYKNAFEWRFEFPEVLNNKGDFNGFDLIIGNPPYIKEDVNRSAFNGLKSKDCYQGKMDIWYLFGDLGLALLKDNFPLCFIATNNWVTNAGASKFRNVVINKSQIISLIDFGPFMVFENASVQTMIIHLRKNRHTDNYLFDFRRITSNKPTQENVLNLLAGVNTTSSQILPQLILKELLNDKTLTFNTDINSSLLSKIKARQNFFLRGKPNREFDQQAEVGSGIDVLQDFVSKTNAKKLNSEIKPGDGVFVLNRNELEKLKLSENEKDIVKPYYTTEQLGKYYGNSFNQYWILYTKSDIGKLDRETNRIPINDYPKIKHHLDKFKAIITSDNKPYGLHRTREQHLFEGEKIFALRKCPKEPRFTYTNFDCFVSRAFLIVQSSRIDLKYLTGLLNSKLVAFWLRNKGKMQGNNYQLDKEPLLEIPIYESNGVESNKIISLINEILEEKKVGRDTTMLEQQIDTLVYQLYELTPEEIAIVEGKQI